MQKTRGEISNIENRKEFSSCWMCGAQDAQHRRLLLLYASDASEAPSIIACVPCLLAEVAACLKLQARPYETAHQRELRDLIVSVARTHGALIVPESGSATGPPPATAEPDNQRQMALAIDAPSGAQAMPVAYSK